MYSEQVCCIMCLKDHNDPRKEVAIEGKAIHSIGGKTG